MANGKQSGIVNIHGREYKTVALRVQEFREQHPDWAIETFIHSADENYVVIGAKISNDQGKVIGTGFAEEKRNATMINKTSALENCETSAIGRALAACGFGGSEYASANEVENAIAQQSTVKIDQKQKKAFYDQVKECLQKGDEHGLAELWSEWDNDEKVVLWSMFNSQERSSMKKMQGEV